MVSEVKGDSVLLRLLLKGSWDFWKKGLLNLWAQGEFGTGCSPHFPCLRSCLSGLSLCSELAQNNYWDQTTGHPRHFNLTERAKWMDLSLVKQCCFPGWVMCRGSHHPCPLCPCLRTGSCSAAATRTTSRLSNIPLVLSSKPPITGLCLPCSVWKWGLAETSEYLLQLHVAARGSSDPQDILLGLSLQPGWVLPSTCCWWSEQEELKPCTDSWNPCCQVP